MSLKDYKLMTGKETRVRLNELGFPVRGDDQWINVVSGLLVALVEEVQDLRKALDKPE